MKKWLAVFVLFGLTAPVWAALDINTATQAELAAVKGLGPAKARAIIKYREKHGPFLNLNDLINVKGMNRESVAKLGVELAKAEAKPAEKPKK
jgi:competence protein ComEA